MFAYDRAAEVLARTAMHTRVPLERRVTSGRDAITLFKALGNRQRMQEVYGVVQSLPLTRDNRAHLAYVVATFDYDRWSAGSPDIGSNRLARIAATTALQDFYAVHGHTTEGAALALEASWRIATLKKAGGDPTAHAWLMKSVDAWQFLRASNRDQADLLPFADYGGEAAYELLAAELATQFQLPRTCNASSVPQLLKEAAFLGRESWQCRRTDAHQVAHRRH